MLNVDANRSGEVLLLEPQSLLLCQWKLGQHLFVIMMVITMMMIMMIIMMIMIMVVLIMIMMMT